MSRDPEEERFAREDSRKYSGWSSAITIVAILVVLAIVFLVYQLKYFRAGDCRPQKKTASRRPGRSRNKPPCCAAL
jgi:hypothetical protein